MVALLESWILFAAEKQTLLQRLDPLTRAKVLSALGALVILGALMMVLTYLGGRFARNYANRPADIREPGPLPTPHPDDWADKPVYPDEGTEDD